MSRLNFTFYKHVENSEGSCEHIFWFEFLYKSKDGKLLPVCFAILDILVPETKYFTSINDSFSWN